MWLRGKELSDVKQSEDKYLLISCLDDLNTVGRYVSLVSNDVDPPLTLCQGKILICTLYDRHIFQLKDHFMIKHSNCFHISFYQSKFSAPMKVSWVKVSVEKVTSFHQQVNHSWPWMSTVSSIPHPTKRLLYFDKWVKSFLTWYIIWIHFIVTLFQQIFNLQVLPLLKQKSFKRTQNECKKFYF